MTGNIKPDDAHYCPFCQRSIMPERDEEGELVTVDGGLVYVHDDVVHDEDYTFGGLQ